MRLSFAGVVVCAAALCPGSCSDGTCGKKCQTNADCYQGADIGCACGRAGVCVDLYPTDICSHGAGPPEPPESTECYALGGTCTPTGRGGDVDYCRCPETDPNDCRLKPAGEWVSRPPELV